MSVKIDGKLTTKKKAKAVEMTDYSEHLNEAKPVVGMVSTEHKKAGEDWKGTTSETEVIHKGVFSKGYSITIEGGRTLNLGNYESARIGVTITIPCEKETLDEAYEYGTSWIDEKINAAVATAKGEK